MFDSDNQRIPRIWNIALNAWIIQDGNYPDFFVGQTAEFAVEFHQRKGAPLVSSSLPISAVSISDLAYRVVGSTISQSDRITILDIGIFVYRKFSPDTDHFEADQVFITELELGVDPYFYFEILSKLPNVPALIYSWRIAAILQKTGPFESGLSSGQKIGVCDKKRRSYKEITERMLGTTKKVDALSTYFSASYYRLSPNS